MTLPHSNMFAGTVLRSLRLPEVARFHTLEVTYRCSQKNNKRCTRKCSQGKIIRHVEYENLYFSLFLKSCYFCIQQMSDSVEKLGF